MVMSRLIVDGVRAEEKDALRPSLSTRSGNCGTEYHNLPTQEVGTTWSTYALLFLFSVSCLINC